ncbi:hypothetical protein O181_026981 [Austropuccinia psidii MF-1]|uniref:Uncharacterized protein n=1 Tax=Austropuccinia psidii MF-1 TaxID=1389203 RepID=A0A9Q3CRK1_9BASI|nr:hypothetical protein [Austropuccinia psidii MF-1]
MSPVHLRNLDFQGNQPEDREGLSRTRGPGGGHLGHSGGWKDIEGNHTHSSIYIPIQQKPQTRGLEGYGSSFSTPLTPQRTLSMKHGKQEVQPSITLGRNWSKCPEDILQRDRLQRPYGNHQRLESHQAVQTLGDEGKQDKGEASHYPSYRRTANLDRAYSDSFRLTGRSFQDKKRIQDQKQDRFQPNAERVRPNDPEAVGLGERNTQDPEIVVHTSIISSPINRNITPTQIEHNFVTPESNLNSDALWSQMSQFAEKTQKKFAELQASHERMKILTASMDKTVKTLQEGHAQLRKASEETSKRLKKVLEFKYKPREIVAEVNKKNNSCHNFGSTDYYANNFPKEKKKIYAIEKVPEEEFPTEDSESDSMDDALREKSDEDQDPTKEFLVEYQEETPLEIQDRQLEAHMPQDTENKNLCKHTHKMHKNS